MSENPIESVAPTTVSVAVSSGASAGPVEDPHAWDVEALRSRAASWLHARGASATSLLTFGVALGGIAAFVLLAGHPGLGGLLGLLAVLASELAVVPQTLPSGDVTRLVRGANPIIDVMLGAGVFGGMAMHQSAPMVLLAFLALVFLVWLPRLPAAGGLARFAENPGLLRRGESLGLLLLGVLLGRTAPALVMIIVVGGFDAWLRLERLAAPVTMQASGESRAWPRVITHDGSFTPMARWTAVGLTLLAMLVLPQSGAWRF